MSKRQTWGCHMRGGEVYRDQYGDERCSDHPAQPPLYQPPQSTTTNCYLIGDSVHCTSS